MNNRFKYVMIILLMVCAAITGGIISMADETVCALYSENAPQQYAVRVQDNEYAMQFRTKTEITGIDIYIYKVSINGAKELAVSVYAWNKNYAATVAAEPAASAVLSELNARDWASFSCTDDTGAGLPAGEYLVVFENGKGNVQLEIAAPAREHTRTYLNTSARNGSIKMQLRCRDGGSPELEAISENYNEYVTSSDTWAAVDGLGREVGVTLEDTTREGKYVGVFFHTWHGHNAPTGTRNITEILKKNPEIVNDYSSPLWGHGGAYFWNEPIWGYYQTADEWVLRRQAELLADAQVDVVFFDNTNGTNTFLNDVYVLLKVWAQARADGVKTPQICFMLPMFDYHDVAVQLREIYDGIYSQGLYQDLWFYWKGKPLVVGYPGELDLSNPKDAEIMDFFNYRVINHSQSADHIQVQKPDGTPVVMGAIQEEIKNHYTLWNWISVYPQLVNRNPDGTPEQVAVAIAHNWCKETHLTAMNDPNGTVFGRHYSAIQGGYDTREDAKLYGAYFSEQWEYALSVDPEFIWVTGWNEWVAGRFEDFLGVENAFPDNFSDAYSRDIEPSAGDLKDHYYYQMVQYIRKFKGTGAVPPAQSKNTVDIYAEEDQWAQIGPHFESYTGDVFDRDARGYQNDETGEYFVYTDQTGRNDIAGAKVAFDDAYIYFMVETAEALSPYTDPAWMRLLIEVVSVDGKPAEGSSWEGFQYIVNRNTPENETTSLLERSAGGWNWEAVGAVRYSVSGSRLQIQIPRSMLGLSHDHFTLNFKWSDNMQTDGDVMDFYTHGDTAPGGRFRYQYVANFVPASHSGSGGNRGGLWKVLTAGAAILLAGGAAAVIGLRSRRKKRQPDS